jgi:hypothetical protein
MTDTTPELIKSWKQARIIQIKKLFSGGATRQELVSRFGAQAVSDALDKTKRYY